MASFVETMRGELTDDAGTVRAVSFEVHAVGTGGGHHTLEGVVSLAGWTEAASAEGTLTMRLRPPSIAYALAWRADDGRRLQLVACKHPTWRAPLHSMTWMHAEVRAEDGRVIAAGPMRFRIAEFPRFAASWLPRRSPALRRLEARQRQLERAALAHGAPLP